MKSENPLPRLLSGIAFLLFLSRQSTTLAAAILPSQSPIMDQEFEMSQLNDPYLRECAKYAISQINNRTCLTLNEAFEQPETADVHFLQTAPNGICGINRSNSSILLNQQCLTDGFDVCLQLLGGVLTDEKKAVGAVIGHLNEHFECHGEVNCNLQCENGGILSARECFCQCPFNGLFQGETCAELVKFGEYTDSSCGRKIVTMKEANGLLKLNAPLDNRTYCQWLLQAESPWARFEISFPELDLSKKFAGIEDCLDRFQVYGLEGTPKYSVKCSKGEAPNPSQIFQSAGNTLLFQLEGGRYDPIQRNGPVVQFVLREPFTDEIHEQTKTGTASSDSMAADGQHSVNGDWNGNNGALDQGGIFGGNGISLLATLFIVLIAVSVTAVGSAMFCLRQHRHRLRSAGSGAKGKHQPQQDSASSASVHVPLPTSLSPVPTADETTTA